MLDYACSKWPDQISTSILSFFEKKKIFIPQACFWYWLQLQVPDEALSLVISMGFKECDAKRALRMNNQDVGGAVDFLVEQKAKREEKREEDIKRRDEIM